MITIAFWYCIIGLVTFLYFIIGMMWSIYQGYLKAPQIVASAICVVLIGVFWPVALIIIMEVRAAERHPRR